MSALHGEEGLSGGIAGQARRGALDRSR
jgi:hypothetical protein